MILHVHIVKAYQSQHVQEITLSSSVVSHMSKRATLATGLGVGRFFPRKVWLLLEEKQVDYETEKVPMRSYGHQVAYLGKHGADFMT